jgi:hypothetical protein
MTTVRQNPPDHRGGSTLETLPLEAGEATYDHAYTQLVDQVRPAINWVLSVD